MGCAAAALLLLLLGTSLRSSIESWATDLLTEGDGRELGIAFGGMAGIAFDGTYLCMPCNARMPSSLARWALVG